MWSSSIGAPFVLPPKHAAVFRQAAACFTEYADVLEDAGEDQTVFERLTRGQKQLAILLVARPLLDPTTEPPRITAVLAATVAAIYEYLQTMLDLEIAEGKATTLRQWILDALGEWHSWREEEPLALLSPACQDVEEWWEIIEILGDTVLADHHFEMEAYFLDAPPEEAAARKAELHIDPDYFVTPIDDPSPQRLEKIHQELRSLLGHG